jgi:dienelactone hydrolase
MSFLWYWPGGGWDFDKWKAAQKWQPIQSEQSNTHELASPVAQGATLEQWQQKRRQWQQITDELLGSVTDRPPTKVNWDFISDVFENKGKAPYTMRRLRYRLTDEEWGYAWLLVPSNLKRSGPAVIALHQTACSGKDEVVGLETLPEQTNCVWYGKELAQEGFVVFAPDAIAFGERQSGHANTFYRSADQFFQVHPQGSVMRKMMYDVSRAIDVMEQLDQVDPRRIGCMGHSHGGYGTLFAMLGDDRIKAGVISCGIDLLRHDPNPERWWRRTALIPRLGLYEGKMEQTPIDFQIWLAMLAPRPTLVLNATRDQIFPNTARLPEAMDLSRQVYRLHGAADKLQGFHFASDHSLTAEAKGAAYKMLKDVFI